MRMVNGIHWIAVVAIVLVAAGCSDTAAVTRPTGGPTIAKAQRLPDKGPQYRIAVADFANSAAQQAELGKGMADMLADALFNTGRFIVLERERLPEVTGEQDLARGKRFNPATAPPLGQLEGAQLLIRGTITAFEPACQGGSLIIVSARQACLSLNLRIVDVATGRVVSAVTVDATSADSRVGILFAGGDLPVGLGAYRKTPMEQALRNAIETAVNTIASTKL